MRGICCTYFAVGFLMIEEIGRNPAPPEEELCNLKGYEFIWEPRFGIFVWPSRLSWEQFTGGDLCDISHQATLPVFPLGTGVNVNACTCT